MTRFSEHPITFAPRRSGSVELTASEQATIFAAREILSRHINRKPGPDLLGCRDGLLRLVRAR